jgi:transposase
MADEVGFLMNPCLKATWAPVGQTPVVPYRNRHHKIPDGPIDLVWDNLQAHKSPLVKELVSANPRLRVHYLPPYAPDLNAVEPLWSLTKYHRMANHSIDNLDELHATAKRHVDAVSSEQHLLQSCFKAAGLALSLPRAQ